MIIFLYGPDSYRRIRKFRELFASYKTKNPSLDVLEADCSLDPDGWLRVRDFLVQPSMFASAKLAIVREPTEVEGSAWTKVLRSHVTGEKTFILASDSSLKPPARFKFLLEPPCVVQQFGELSGAELTAFLKAEAKVRGANLSPAAFRTVASYAEASGFASWAGATLLEQCALTSREVAPADVLAFIDQSPRLDVFKESQTLAGRTKVSDRIAVLEQLLLQGDAPARIFNSIAYGVRGQDLVRLADLDISVKGGGLEYEQALLDFVLAP